MEKDKNTKLDKMAKFGIIFHLFLLVSATIIYYFRSGNIIPIIVLCIFISFVIKSIINIYNQNNQS
jgi:Na+/H+-dicarboxylate symporter